VMKKALQIPHLRAPGSVSDRAVVRNPNESRFYGFRDRFAQVLIRDACRELGCRSCLLRRGLDGRCRQRLGRRCRQRSWGEAKPRAAGESIRDLTRPLSQFEAPDRIANVDDERPVRLGPRRPRVTCNLVPAGAGPRRARISAATVGTEPAELGAYLIADRLHYATASSTFPGVTSRS